jgi:hypothetical protein
MKLSTSRKQPTTEKTMKTILIIGIAAMTACYSAKGNELVGQVKKVTEKTPLICGDYVVADLSLGVIRNGVGSMSREDIDLYVERPADIATVKLAAETGRLVKVTYNTRRSPWCVPDHWVTAVTIVDDTGKTETSP